MLGTSTKTKGVLLPIVMSTVFTTVVGGLFYAHKITSINNAITVVEKMYSFSNSKDLADNFMEIKGKVSSEVFEQIDVDSPDMSIYMNKYDRFKGSPAKVIVVEATESHIVYRLDNKHISKNLEFMFKYETSITGKISRVEEFILGRFD